MQWLTYTLPCKRLTVPVRAGGLDVARTHAAAAAVLAVMAGIGWQWATSMNETDGARCDGL